MRTNQSSSSRVLMSASSRKTGSISFEKRKGKFRGFHSWIVHHIRFTHPFCLLPGSVFFGGVDENACESGLRLESCVSCRTAVTSTFCRSYDVGLHFSLFSLLICRPVLINLNMEIRIFKFLPPFNALPNLFRNLQPCRRYIVLTI